MNERLRRAILASASDELQIAMRLGVDPKTVERWVSGRLPYPRYRRALADMLGIDEKILWPQRKQQPSAAKVAPVAINAAYPHRWAVPRTIWVNLFASAEKEIALLTYAALFIAEDNGITRTLSDKARSGVRVRILLGDPEGFQVAARGASEGIGDAITAKVRNAIRLYEPLTAFEGTEIRLHDTALYASIYRADTNLLVNAHAYGVPASHAPVIAVQHISPGDMAEVYLESFERIWDNAKAMHERSKT